MADNQFNEDRAVYDTPVYTLGQLLDAPESIPDAIRGEMNAALKKLIDEGDASGPAEPFDFDEFIAEMTLKHKQRQ
jgi:Bacterial antitoxin of ParD toxin-antitoxin type II system and RHH